MDGGSTTKKVRNEDGSDDDIFEEANGTGMGIEGWTVRMRRRVMEAHRQLCLAGRA